MTTEAQEQMAFVEMCAWHPILRDHLFAIPNGGSRHPKEAMKLRLQGVKAGVADLFIPYPVPPYAGMFIELKRAFPRRGKLTELQAQFLNKMASVGYATCVAYSASEAWTVAMQYLDGEFEQQVKYDVTK